MKLTESHSLSLHALNALSDDVNLPICTACGTQYPGPVKSCQSRPTSVTTEFCIDARTGPVCEDPRQFVPESGQTFTSLSELSSTRDHHVTPDKQDSRISFISTEPPFGINQTRKLICVTADIDM